MSNESKTIGVLGTLDTKGEEFAYVVDGIRKRGHQTLLIDVGTGEQPKVKPDISREEVAAAGKLDLPKLMQGKDRGECVGAMTQAATILVSQLAASGKIQGVFSMGGGGGTAIASSAMRHLPLGFPKVLVSTLASGNTTDYVGSKDLVMFPSIVDVAGLNRISRIVFRRAVGAICGMVETELDKPEQDRPLIAASMFGNTTDCVNQARDTLEKAGYEVLTFHATGTGGRTMETLIEEGLFVGVLDVTTTELADELVSGILSAGPHRLEAAGKQGIPTVIAPGCLDMVNFGAYDSVPDSFKERNLYVHNPQVTLMRTTPHESGTLGHLLATKANQYRGPLSVVLPKKAISVISAPGQAFHDPEADQSLFGAIRETLSPDIELIETDLEINNPDFSAVCAKTLLSHLKQAPFPRDRHSAATK